MEPQYPTGRLERFVFLLGCVFVLLVLLVGLVLLVRAKSFRKKTKEFKTALMLSGQLKASVFFFFFLQKDISRTKALIGKKSTKSTKMN